MRLNQVCNPMRDNACFPAACTSQEQERTFNVRNSFALLRIHACKEIH